MRTCKECRFAVWQRTVTGLVKSGVSGTCKWKPTEPIAVPKMIADSVRQRFNYACQYGIWWEDEMECEAWEPKE